MASIVPLVTRLATVTDGHMQGRNEGGTIPQVPNHHGGAKSLRVAVKSKNVTSVCSMQYIFFPPTSVSNRGAPNLLLAPSAI